MRITVVSSFALTLAGCSVPYTKAPLHRSESLGASSYPGSVERGEVGFAYLEDDTHVPGAPAGSKIAFNNNPAGPPGRHAALIGLYGELMSRPSPGVGQFDGAGNLSQITAAAEGACFDPDTSPDGKWMVLASTQHHKTADIYLRSTTGRTMTQLTSDPADDLMPQFSPDGQQIAFASSRDGNWNIYVKSIDGGPAVQLTNDFDQELHPTWSPDGRTIAYCKLGAQSGRWELWMMDLDNRVPRFLDYGLFPEWNPDPARNKLTFQRARQRGSRLFSVWTIDVIDGESKHPTEIVSAANAAAMHPSWSPDGSRLVFITVVDPNRSSTKQPEQSDVWIIDVDGTNRTNLTNGRFRNLFPVWAPDGTVYFLSDRSGVDNIWAVATSRTVDIAVPSPMVTVDPASMTNEVGP